jgi:hypothetical protein
MPETPLQIGAARSREACPSTASLDDAALRPIACEVGETWRVQRAASTLAPSCWYPDALAHIRDELRQLAQRFAARLRVEGHVPAATFVAEPRTPRGDLSRQLGAVLA